VQTILGLKACGSTVIVITHRPNVLAAVDLMVILHDGQVKAVGPRDEVLAALQRSTQAATQGAAGAAPAIAAPAAA
jgi:ATP-binding cassette subfamily C exporter for protease/lipase